MKQSNKRTIIFVISSLLLLVGGLALAIRLGSVHITFSDIWNSIFNYNETLELMLVRDVRIPRALCVLFTGGVLGVTGAMIQGVTRNPIAEPSILGISQGATLVISIFYATGIGITTQNVMIASFIGALLTGVIVLGFIFNCKDSFSRNSNEYIFHFFNYSNRSFIKSISNDRILGIRWI